MKKIFLVGIGGSGLSAIARLLLESGYEVSGSDQASSPITSSLSNLGATVYTGHRADQVLGVDLVIQSSAIPDDNPEVSMARQLGIPVQKRAAFLEGFLRGKRLVAVAGTAGKTTTTAMIAWVLTCLEMDPGYLIGGISRNLATNSHGGKSDVFIIEADEYDRMFHGLHPWLAVITNAEHDHPDMFPTPADYFAAFDGFIKNIQSGGKLLVHQAVPDLLSGYHQLEAQRYTFGPDENASYQPQNMRLLPNGCYQFDVLKHSGQATGLLTSVSLCVPGKHNVLNALAALAAVDLLDLPAAEAAHWLGEFKGVQRRLEIIGTVNGIIFIDDYAHHPVKIRSTLQAARAMFPERRIWAVWQPHTFTRTAALFDDFSTAFDDADQLLITEVYAGREKKTDFSSARLVEKINRENCNFMPDLQQTRAYLAAHIRPGDVVIVLSAGDANSIIPELAALLEARDTGESRKRAPGAQMVMRPTQANLPAEMLRKIFGDRLQTNVRMSRFSSARVGGPVEYLVICDSAPQLEADVCKLWENHIPFMLLGGASNVLVSEKGLRGLVIINHARANRVQVENTPPSIWAESGALMSTIVQRAGAASLSGLEWATALPGTLGGALYGNAGAFGSEISQNLVLANILHVSQGKVDWTRSQFDYQYRSSVMKRHPDNEVLILAAELKLEHGDYQTIADLMKTLKSKRETRQPPGACTGSMFKNPEGEYAGRLIEAAGLRGTKIGDVEISLKHGNFFINNGKGTASDFMSLIRLTRETVAAKFGIEMELEVELLGDWDI